MKKETDETVNLPVSLRDYFAGQALVGLPIVWANAESNLNPQVIAINCYKIADAMLKQREETP